MRALLLAALFAATAAGAQDWPSKPIRWVVPSSPEELARVVKRELLKWAEVVRSAHIKAD